MRKTRKRISAFLVCAMLAALLSGCYEGIDTTIHADGSGTMTTYFGVSADELAQMSEEDAEGYEPFELDGVTYYGTVSEQSFASVEEFNEIFSGNGQSIRLEAENGGLTLTIDNRPGEEEPEQPEEAFEWTEERRAARAEELFACFRARATGGFRDNDLREAANYFARMSAEETDEAFAYEIENYSACTVEWLNASIWFALDTVRNGTPLYPLTEAQREARRAAIERLLAERSDALTDEDRAFYAMAMSDWYDEYYTDEEFAEELDRLRALDAEALREELAFFDGAYSRPLTEAQRAARRAEIESALDALAVKLTDEEKAFYADAMSDWYDEYYTDEGFAEEMESLRAMSEEELRGELAFFDEYYGAAAVTNPFEDSTVRWTIRFDDPAKQIEGPTEGVSVKGGTVTLDVMQMVQELYRFTTRTDMGVAYEHGQTVEIDGAPVELDCYAVRTGNYETNYVRVRALAGLLSGSPAQFDVRWSDAVEIRSGAAYTGENDAAAPFRGEHLYYQGGYETRVDGKAAELDSIVLYDEDGNGYTYYKLRDLGEALGFNVRWDAARKTVCIETDRLYTAED